jgi:hypothetical protein
MFFIKEDICWAWKLLITSKVKSHENEKIPSFIDDISSFTLKLLLTVLCCLIMGLNRITGYLRSGIFSIQFNSVLTKFMYKTRFSKLPQIKIPENHILNMP